MELPEIPTQERTPLVEALLGIIRQLLDRVRELEETNQQLRDEIATLKGQKPRPQIQPSLLEGAKAKGGSGGGTRSDKSKRPKNAQLIIHHEITLHPDNLPVGARLQSYESYVVQDLIIRSDNTALSQFGQTRGQIRRRLIGTMTRPFGILGVSPTDFVTASRKTLYDLALW